MYMLDDAKKSVTASRTCARDFKLRRLSIYYKLLFKIISVSLIIDNDVKKSEHKIIITTILYNTYDDVQNMYHNTNLRLYEQQYITIIIA